MVLGARPRRGRRIVTDARGLRVTLGAFLTGSPIGCMRMAKSEHPRLETQKQGFSGHGRGKRWLPIVARPTGTDGKHFQNLEIPLIGERPRVWWLDPTVPSELRAHLSVIVWGCAMVLVVAWWLDPTFRAHACAGNSAVWQVLVWAPPPWRQTSGKTLALVARPQ